MERQMLEIKYRCMHGSCCVNCREGLIGIDEGLFNELSSHYEEPELFRSPKGICRLGFSQTFKVLKKEKDSAKKEPQQPRSPEQDPIFILMEEHKTILGLMAKIEEQVRKRDVEGLWVTTIELENDINLHSGLKEEEALFPVLKDLLPLGEGLVAIVREDHREIMSLLHNFRTALQEETILDGIIRSMIVSLKSHIRKEDYEFFDLINKCLDDSIRDRIIEAMDKVTKTYVKMEPGERRRKVNLDRERFDDDILAVKDLVNVDGGCCGH